MGIRIRDRRGKAAEIQDDFLFVEICDKNGDIAALVYSDDAGAIKVLTSKDPDSERYTKMYGAKFCPILPVKAPK